MCYEYLVNNAHLDKDSWEIFKNKSYHCRLSFQ